MYKKTYNFWVLIFAFCFLLGKDTKAQLLPSFGDSRVGSTGFQFLKIEPDARSAAMGGAFIAVVDDVSSLYWNPAGLTQLDSQKLHLQLSHSSYYSAINYQYAGVAWRLSSQSVIGASLYYLNTGDMNVTTEFMPFGTGQTYRAVNMAAALSFAQVLTQNFSFGITGKYINESIAEVTAQTAVVDFGFQYDVGLANLRFAVGINNFGFNTRPKGEIEHLTLNGPQLIDEFEEIAVPAIFRLGLAWDPLVLDDHRITVSGQLNHPTDNNETFAFGTEYTWNRFLFFRAGYEFGVDEGGFPAFGFGMQYDRDFGRLSFDYGFTNKASLGNIHRFTIGLSLL
ncbi:MAG: hypothetical protein EA412_07305 [Chitinophagaceae bacterium]|nr:MAG: hypothetical protein EA412_07305 [Chitinophagaceae bacterium]